MKKILLVEDDALISSLVEFRLKKDGYNLFLVKDGNSAIQQIEENQYDLIITDVMIPFKSGLDIIQFANQKCPDTPIIVLSSLGDEENTVVEAFKLGVKDFISKPFNPNELAIRIKRVLN